MRKNFCRFSKIRGFRGLLTVGIAVIIAGGLSSCANKQVSPVLIERGSPEYERNYQVVQEGYGIDPKLKKIFVAGYVAEGMNQYMVQLLWGTPDKSKDCDEFENCKTWEYINYKTNDVITRLKWDFDENYKGADWLNASKLVDIEGDPYGGSPPPPVIDNDGVY